MVAAEVGLAVVLLAGAGLLLRSFQQIRAIDLTTLRDVDLRGATVSGELWLGDDEGAPEWEEGSSLDLRHATVQRLVAQGGQDNLDSVRLAGLRYDWLGGYGEQTDEQSSAEAAAGFLVEWLGDAEKEHHTPEAHEQFARVLHKQGLHTLARETLYESGNHDLSRAVDRRNPLTVLSLLAQKVFIGYGHRVYYSLGWITALIVAGWIVARATIPVSNGADRLGFWYSLDRLLPIIELSKEHYAIDLPRRPRIYFYFHTMMGYLLATFLLAGLSGLVG